MAWLSHSVTALHLWWRASHTNQCKTKQILDHTLCLARVQQRRMQLQCVNSSCNQCTNRGISEGDKWRSLKVADVLMCCFWLPGFCSATRSREASTTAWEREPGSGGTSPFMPTSARDRNTNTSPRGRDDFTTTRNSLTHTHTHIHTTHNNKKTKKKQFGFWQVSFTVKRTTRCEDCVSYEGRVRVRVKHKKHPVM